MRRTWFAVATAAVVFLLAAPQVWAVRLEEGRVFIEFNATDRDVGFHAFLDGEQWKRMKLFDPHGRKLLDIAVTGQLGDIGLTELFFEGEEPSLDELPLDEFLKLFPEGVYLFLGETVDGQKLHRRARFSHDIPDAPVVISPPEDTPVDPDHVVISWQPVTTPPGIEIAGYEVIVGSFDITLPPTTTSVAVPAGFLKPGTEHGFEVLSIAANHNQTITEGHLTTE